MDKKHLKEIKERWLNPTTEIALAMGVPLKETTHEDVKFLIEQVERYEKALEEITRQYDYITVNRAKEIANEALGELSDKRRREIQSY